jgi:hypothetical protein
MILTAMNYDSVSTPEEILVAFQQCEDAGEQMDLFEALAWRNEPPIEAFVEIVQQIKLEPVLALVTQAFGWVRNEAVRKTLKESDDLLSILANLVRSGETDLIRWSAAQSIIVVGFDLISVWSYLTEAPQDIVDGLVKNNLDHLHKKQDNELSRTKLINFWVYGDTNKLYAFTKSHTNQIALDRSSEILHLKNIRGVQENTRYLMRSFQRMSSEESENLFFTLIGQEISEDTLKKALDGRNVKSLHLEAVLRNQICCLNSQGSKVRDKALEILLDYPYEYHIYVDQSIATVLQCLHTSHNAIVSANRMKQETEKRLKELEDSHLFHRQSS